MSQKARDGVLNPDRTSDCVGQSGGHDVSLDSSCPMPRRDRCAYCWSGSDHWFALSSASYLSNFASIR